VADLGLKENHEKLLILSYLQKPVFLNFGFEKFGGGAAGQKPLFGCALGT